MIIEHKNNHVDEALELLLEQYKNKEKFKSLLSSYMVQVQKIEDALWQLYSETGLETAIGTQLDGLGRILKEPRNGRVDARYRVFLKARILSNRSSGTVEELLAVIELVTASTPTRITEYFPACIEVLMSAPLPGDITPQDLLIILLKTKMAGVCLTLKEGDAEEDYRFEFSEIIDTPTFYYPNKGFSTEYLPQNIDSTGQGPTAPDNANFMRHSKADGDDSMWVSGTTSHILWNSIDDGESWISQDLGTYPWLIAAFNSATRQWMVGGGTPGNGQCALMSDLSARTFALIDPPDSKVNGLGVNPDTNVWVASSDDGKFYRTVGLPPVWNEQDVWPITPGIEIYDVAHVMGNVWVMVGEGGRVWISINDGFGFLELEYGRPKFTVDFRKVRLTDFGLVIIGDDGVFLKAKDEYGIFWNQIGPAMGSVYYRQYKDICWDTIGMYTVVNGWDGVSLSNFSGGQNPKETFQFANNNTGVGLVGVDLNPFTGKILMATTEGHFAEVRDNAGGKLVDVVTL